MFANRASSFFSPCLRVSHSFRCLAPMMSHQKPGAKSLPETVEFDTLGLPPAQQAAAQCA